MPYFGLGPTSGMPAHTDLRAEGAHVDGVLRRYPQIGRLTRKGRPAFYTYMRSVYHESRDIETLVKLIEGQTP